MPGQIPNLAPPQVPLGAPPVDDPRRWPQQPNEPWGSPNRGLSGVPSGGGVPGQIPNLAPPQVPLGAPPVDNPRTTRPPIGPEAPYGWHYQPPEVGFRGGWQPNAPPPGTSNEVLTGLPRGQTAPPTTNQYGGPAGTPYNAQGQVFRNQRWMTPQEAASLTQGNIQTSVNQTFAQTQAADYLQRTSGMPPEERTRFFADMLEVARQSNDQNRMAIAQTALSQLNGLRL